MPVLEWVLRRFWLNCSQQSSRLCRDATDNGPFDLKKKTRFPMNRKVLNLIWFLILSAWSRKLELDVWCFNGLRSEMDLGDSRASKDCPDTRREVSSFGGSTRGRSNDAAGTVIVRGIGASWSSPQSGSKCTLNTMGTLFSSNNGAPVLKSWWSHVR